MELDIQIATGSTTPIYRQIMDQIRRRVASGRISVGDQLPSVRSLANRLVLNHNTVARAYNELVRDGVLESRQGRGAFVAERRPVFSAEERERRLDQAIDSLLSEALALDCSRKEIESAVNEKLDALSRSSLSPGGELGIREEAPASNGGNT